MRYTCRCNKQSWLSVYRRYSVRPGENPLAFHDHNYIVLFCHVQRANKEQAKKFEFLLLVT